MIIKRDFLYTPKGVNRTLHIHLPEDDFDIIFLSNSGYCDNGRSEIAEIAYRAFYDASAVSEKPLAMDTGYV